MNTTVSRQQPAPYNCVSPQPATLTIEWTVSDYESQLGDNAFNTSRLLKLLRDFKEKQNTID